MPLTISRHAVDYESLAQLGSIMGSGGMIVMDDTSCMVDVAKYFMDFCMTESCGKCIPCRVGTYQMNALLGKITHYRGHPAGYWLDRRSLRSAEAHQLVRLGISAPNPVLSTLRYFAEEYQAHIVSSQCPAGVCGARQSEARQPVGEEAGHEPGQPTSRL